MGELIGGFVWGQYNSMYARLFGGCSQEQEKIIATMEDIAFVHNLLSRTDTEISSPLVLAFTISFVYNTFCLMYIL